MTKDEFKQAVQIAENEVIDLSQVDDSELFGCGLPSFKPVHTTLRTVAKLLRWQALQLNGEWDAAALDEMATIARRRFQIIGV